MSNWRATVSVLEDKPVLHKHCHGA